MNRRFQQCVFDVVFLGGHDGWFDEKSRVNTKVVLRWIGTARRDICMVPGGGKGVQEPKSTHQQRKLGPDSYRSPNPRPLSGLSLYESVEPGGGEAFQDW